MIGIVANMLDMVAARSCADESKQANHDSIYVSVRKVCYRGGLSNRKPQGAALPGRLLHQVTNLPLSSL